MKLCSWTCAIGFLFFSTSGLAQRAPLDTNALAKWPRLPGFSATLSNDGRYAAYVIDNQPIASRTTVIQALDTAWKLELPGAEKLSFSEDSKRAVYQRGTDTLCVITIREAPACISPVKSFRLVRHGHQEWLTFQKTTPEKPLVIRDLTTGKEHNIASVADYWVSDSADAMVVQTESKTDSTTPQALNWMGTPDADMTRVWVGSKARKPVLDTRGTQFAFTVGDTTSAAGYVLWYYKAGTPQAVMLADDHTAGIDPSLQLGDASGFSPDGKRLFLSLREKLPPPNPKAVKVDVWSYFDPKLQSDQLSEVKNFSSRDRGRRYRAMIELTSPPKVLRLTNLEDETGFWDGDDDVLLLRQVLGDQSESYWSTTGQTRSFLIWPKTGQRKELRLTRTSFSPAKRYVIGYDQKFKDLYTYEIETGITRNLTSALPIPLVDDNPTREPGQPLRFIRVLTWLPNDTAILVADQFDLWRLDPKGQKSPINLTHGYGRRHYIVFRPVSSNGFSEAKVVDESYTRIVNAFNRTTKEMGFFRVPPGGNQDPIQLTMGAYAYPPNGSDALGRVVKARDAQVYLLKREAPTEFPNYYTTRDFQRFTAVSDLHPQRDYAWPTAELRTFTSLQGRRLQGVLYKPPSFDPTKKYPVILNFYEHRSQELNYFKEPGDRTDELAIPWFVSRDYVVFVPDIYFTIGDAGPSAYAAIIGAANYLARFPWVDSARMGIQGHSFSAWETNYVIGRTTRFAAAVSSAGVSDLISNYGQLWGESSGGRAEQIENRQYRMGATVWQRPDLYISNSPIFRADKVTTPLLIVANKRDANVVFAQGLEFFQAMRRLGKRAWMLQYDESSHGEDGKDKVDYVVRTTQFFDYYLMGASAPKWMTRGVPARLKGIDTGLELDAPGKSPGPGLVATPLWGTSR